MNEKAKYAIILLLAIGVSSATSYLITSYSHSTSTKIFPAFNVNIGIDLSDVQVNSSVAIHNLTIVYQYKSLNGTMNTVKVGYGDYAPFWGAGVVINSGTIPYATYRIPDSIISACSTTKFLYDEQGLVDGKTWIFTLS